MPIYGSFAGKKIVSRIPLLHFKRFVLIVICAISVRFVYEGIVYLMYAEFRLLGIKPERFVSSRKKQTFIYYYKFILYSCKLKLDSGPFIMIFQDTKSAKLIELLLRDFTSIYTISSIAAKLGLTRMGAWNIVKALQSKKIIISRSTGTGKTSTKIISLNRNNPVLDKYLVFSLSEQASQHNRWLINFEQLNEYVSFLILFGSILTSPKHANDIDIIAVVPDKSKFKKIHKEIDNLQHVLVKEIHAINFTEEEFRKELLKPNEAFLDSVKKGIVLFGQEKFIEFMKKIHKVKI